MSTSSLGLTGQKTAQTVDFAIAANDGNRLYTNEGATGTITATLPKAVVGDEFTFLVRAAQAFRIDPNGTEKISGTDGVLLAAGKYLWADADGEFITIKCFKDGEWTVTASRGTWTGE